MTTTRSGTSGRHGPAEVLDALDRWEQGGLVDAELADRLRADLGGYERRPQPPAPPAVPRESLLTEALSYLGAVLVLVAGGLLTARFWNDLSFSQRVLLAAIATGLLLGAGLVVPARLGAAGRRVRSVLWALSVGAFAALLAIVAVDGWALEDQQVGIAVSGGAGVLAAVLWWRLPSSLQVLALGLPTTVFVAMTAVELLGDHDGVVPGFAVLAVSALGGAAALRGWAVPVRTALALATAGAMFGAQLTTIDDDGWAHALTIAVVVGVVVAAVRLDDLLLLGLGTIGALQVLPRAVAHFFPGLVAAALVLLLAGAGLIASGLLIADRRAKARTPDG